ncbi:tubulin-specific chaperone C [Parasteatoda tepidariorum]|uniref:tubulin-specific chaperone C n=1 Tax=Parasteatoda tepidariorum TaxID=114398 RepID=UPI00077F8531|nr:tubulin-specific chaperone C [Parasteatoda tepidariorum]XP_015928253.1 tubulin-specific chaperone C [Parasteatoda tepidariorum]
MFNNIPAAMKDQKSFEVIVQDCAAEKKEVVDKLVQRSEARVAEMERKKCEKDNRTSVYEQTDYFNVTFNYQKQLIETMLMNATNVDKSNLISYFDKVVKSIQELQKFLSDSTLFLPTYDIKKGQEALKILQDDLQSAQNDLIPKKKFAFKNKKKIQNGVKSPPLVERSTSNNASDSILDLKLCKCGFKDISGENLVKYREEIEKQDVGLHHLQNCRVYLYGAPSTIFISGLTDCHIFAGPVSTSVFIENCSRCTFVLACQQMRIHSCTDCDFYLHITSRTIIEDSKSLYFAPYNWSYDGQEEDFINAGFDKDINNWDSIDDFNWLVIGTPSPNWDFLGKEKYQIWS